MTKKQSEKFGLTEVSPNHWRIHVYVGIIDGKQRQVTKQFEAVGIRAARRRADDEAAILRGQKKKILDSKGTIEDLARRWQKAHDRKDSPSTVYRRNFIVDAIVERFGKVHCNDLTPSEIEAWYDDLRAEGSRSESTLHHYHRQLGAILHQGEKWDYVDRNPIKRVEPPKQNRKRPPKPPTATQFLAMIATASDGLKVAIRIAAATGLRRGEIMGLRMDDIGGLRLRVERAIVEVPGENLIVKGLKHERPRVITIDQGTADAIAAYHADRPGAVYVLPSFTDPTQPRRPGWLSLEWARLCEHHAVEFRLHDLRHMHATLLHAAGIPMAVVSERIGHSVLSTTSDIYTSAEAAGDALAAAAIGRVLDATSTVSG